MTTLDEFFARYEQSANTFDPDIACSLYTGEFLGGGPAGVATGRNGEDLRQAMARRKVFFRQIGFQRAKVLNVEATPLDTHYTLAKVRWRMRFEKEPGQPKEFEFFTTYVLHDAGAGDGPKVAFWISHDDEQRVMREAGLID